MSFLVYLSLSRFIINNNLYYRVSFVLGVLHHFYLLPSSFLPCVLPQRHNLVYYESIKQELKIRPIYECRCDERLQTKVKEFTHLAYTGLLGGLEHLKIETRLINEKIVNALCEYVT